MFNPISKKFEGSLLKLPSTDYKESEILLLNNIPTNKKLKSIKNGLQVIKKEVQNLNYSNQKNSFSNSTNSNDSSSESINENDIPKKELLKKYFELETNKLISQYGNSYLKTSKEIEKKYRIHSSFLNNHKLNPDSRLLMVDWMIEIFYMFNSEASTFFLAVDILDRYLQNAKINIEDKDIHLIGLTCIFIASKIEDLCPFTMKHIVEDLGKNKFKNEKILNKEIEIIQTINFELFNWSTYDYICIQLSDFKKNNKDIIEKLNMKLYFESYENCCFFLSKAVQLNYKFTQYLSSLKGLGCLICGFDILVSNSKTLNAEIIKVFRQWIADLMEESGFKSDNINKFYNSLTDYYKDIIKNEKGILFHLCETHTFYFY